MLNFGGKKLKEAIVEDILSGRKSICLAVSEAFAGSDVAGLRCSAKPTTGGWIVNGTYVIFRGLTELSKSYL